MKVLHVLLAVIVLSLVFACQKSHYRQVQQYTIEQFMNTTSIFGSSFSPDEQKILFTSDASGIFNLYTVPTAGGRAEALTQSDSGSIFSISYFPQDERLLFRADREGNEIWHIYLRQPDGTVRDLTPWEKARSTFAGWAYDEKSFFFLSNKRNPRFMDVYEMPIDTFEPRLLFQNDEAYSFGGISNDRRFMALSKTITRMNSDIYIYDFNEKKLEHITPHEGDVVHEPVTFSVDSKFLYYLTDAGHEFSYLKKYDLASGNSETVRKADWDIMYAYFSHSGKYQVVGINEDAKTKIEVLNTQSGQPVDLPAMPDAEITSVNISKSEQLMTFYVNGSRSPNNLYIYDFSTGRYKKLTDSMSPDIDSEDLVEAQVIRYPSFDDVQIPAVLYKPQQIKPGEQAPALVWVHGGPGGQSRVGYNATIQYFVNHGYVVLAVNNRGSSGYGKTFFALDDQKHGQDDLDDCVMAKEYLISTGYVDGGRIGILGGSYGGYMVLAALTFRPKQFEVGVDLFGISNWVRTLESIPPWWESMRLALYKEMGDPQTQRDMLVAKSPIFHYDNIEKPLMVLQGANDPRVLKVESDEIVEAVKKKGVPVEYVLFDDEGHGFVKKENRIRGYKAILNFLDKYLKGREAG